MTPKLSPTMSKCWVRLINWRNMFWELWCAKTKPPPTKPIMDVAKSKGKPWGVEKITIETRCLHICGVAAHVIFLPPTCSSPGGAIYKNYFPTNLGWPNGPNNELFAATTILQIQRSSWTNTSANILNPWHRNVQPPWPNFGFVHPFDAKWFDNFVCENHISINTTNHLCCQIERYVVQRRWNHDWNTLSAYPCPCRTCWLFTADAEMSLYEKQFYEHIPNNSRITKRPEPTNCPRQRRTCNVNNKFGPNIYNQHDFWHRNVHPTMAKFWVRSICWCKMLLGTFVCKNQFPTTMQTIWFSKSKTPTAKRRNNIETRCPHISVLPQLLLVRYWRRNEIVNKKNKSTNHLQRIPGSPNGRKQRMVCGNTKLAMPTAILTKKPAQIKTSFDTAILTRHAQMLGSFNLLT